MDSMTGDPSFFILDKWDLTMKAFTRFEEILTVGYFLNELLILDMKFANLVPLGCPYMNGMTGDPPPPFLIFFSKGVVVVVLVPDNNGFNFS